MAAVAILGIVYAYLARAASQGILTAGEARWRLEASLLADEAVASLDREIQSGSALPIGQEEFDADPFLITRSIELFNLPEDLFPAPEAGLSLFHLGDTDLAVLRRVRITVAWFDGVHEQSLERITFAYDKATAATVLATIPTGNAPLALDAAPGRAPNERPEDAP